MRRSTRDNVQCKIIAGADYHAPCTEAILEKARLPEALLQRGRAFRAFRGEPRLNEVAFGWHLKSYSSFNVTRSRPKKGDLSWTTLDLIMERNRFDVALYQCAATHFEAAMRKQPGEVKRIAAELKTTRARAKDLLALRCSRSGRRRARRSIAPTPPSSGSLGHGRAGLCCSIK